MKIGEFQNSTFLFFFKTKSVVSEKSKRQITGQYNLNVNKKKKKNIDKETIRVLKCLLFHCFIGLILILLMTNLISINV